MSSIIRITVPISDYYGDEVFMKQLYFECKKNSPTKEQVVKALENIIEQYRQLPDYYGEEDEVLEIIKSVEEWEYVRPHGLVGTNTFVEHPKFGRQSLSWDIIYPIIIN